MKYLCRVYVCVFLCVCVLLTVLLSLCVELKFVFFLLCVLKQPRPLGGERCTDRSMVTEQELTH